MGSGHGCQRQHLHIANPCSCLHGNNILNSYCLFAFLRISFSEMNYTGFRLCRLSGFGQMLKVFFFIWNFIINGLIILKKIPLYFKAFKLYTIVLHCLCIKMDTTQCSVNCFLILWGLWVHYTHTMRTYGKNRSIR